MKNNNLRIVFAVISLSIIILISLLISSTNKLVFFNRATDNQLNILIKLQGQYDQIANPTFKTKVVLYGQSGLTREYSNQTLTKDHQNIFKVTINTTGLSFNQMYAIFIKPDKYLGKLFCSPTSSSANCKTPQIIIAAGSNDLDLTQDLLFSGDISPQDGKIAADDISKISNQVGKTSTDYLSTDINSDGRVQTVDYSLAIYSMSKNYIDDPIPSSWNVSITPTSIPTQPQISTTPTPIPSQVGSVTRRVMVIDFNPVIESQGNKKIRDLKGWANPVPLESQYINDVKIASGGYLNYQIVLRKGDLDQYPTKNNGYVFTDEEYLSALNSPTDNARAIINYNKVLNDYEVCQKLNNNEIDELWLWGGPWFGYYEVTMTGPSAFYTNSSPFSGNSCNKNMIVMGFSYERGISEMVENLGHGLEGTLSHFFGENSTTTSGNYTTPWGKFALSEKVAPGKSGCGWMHYAPNSASDYDWSNKRTVSSTCDDWLNYPNLTNVALLIDCNRWNCDGYQYKKWWLAHLPKASGKTNNYWNNWWKYFAELN